MNILVIGGNGYVGSRIVQMLISLGHNVLVDDLRRRGKGIERLYEGYQHVRICWGGIMATSDLRYYKIDKIIWTAGTADIQSAKDAPMLAYQNNVRHLLEVVSSINKVPLLYMSTSAIYSGMYNATEAENTFYSMDSYTVTKYTADMLIRTMQTENVTCLRLGTVNGVSPNIRTELMLNGMVLSALKNKKITVRGGASWRPILYIDHLMEIIRIWTEGSNIPRLHTDKFSIINVASIQSTISDLAEIVATQMNVPVIDEGGSSPSFTMSINKLRRMVQNVQGNCLCGNGHNTDRNADCDTTGALANSIRSGLPQWSSSLHITKIVSTIVDDLISFYKEYNYV